MLQYEALTDIHGLITLDNNLRCISQSLEVKAEHVTASPCILTGTPDINNYLSSSMSEKLFRSHGYRSEPRLKLVDTRVLKRVTVPKRKAVNRSVIRSFILSPNFVRMSKSRWMRWAGLVVLTGKRGKAIMGFAGKHELNFPPRILRRRCYGNIKSDVKDTGWEDLD